MEVDMLVMRKTHIALVAAAAGLLFAAATFAQPPAQTAPQAAPAAKSAGQAPPAPARGPAGAGRQAGLNLTDAQREQVRALRETQRTDERALREKMRTAREQLRKAMQADVPDEAAVRSAAGAVAALQADQAALRARSRAQFMKVLTPEQQARMKEARARVAQRVQRLDRMQRAERRMLMRRQWRWWI